MTWAFLRESSSRPDEQDQVMADHAPEREDRVTPLARELQAAERASVGRSRDPPGDRVARARAVQDEPLLELLVATLRASAGATTHDLVPDVSRGHSSSSCERGQELDGVTRTDL